MTQWLEILDRLSVADIELLVSIGAEQVVKRDTVLVEENVKIAHLYFVRQGLFWLSRGFGKKTFLPLGPGQIIGGVAFIDNEETRISVIAQEDSLVLAVPCDKLHLLIAQDPHFGIRFYQALGQTLTHRLRMTAPQPGKLRRIGDVAYEIDPLWEDLFSGISDFKELIALVDQRAIANKDTVSDEDLQQVHEKFKQLYTEFNVLLSDEKLASSPIKQEIGKIVKKEFLPLVLLTETAERCYSKPRGYAGDYFSIEMIYRNQPGGYGRLGPVIDDCFLQFPAAQAVRNRRAILVREIMQTLVAKKGEIANVMSIACGPAREILDVLTSVDGENRLRATLLDFDLEALSFVNDEVEKLGLKKQHIELVNENILYLILGKKQLPLKEQDLVYSVGLIDYFKDRIVIKLLDYIYTILQPNGRVILGNFHPKNPSKAFMDHVFDWSLIHRSEEEMDTLFMRSKFKKPCDRIIFEEEGINLFAECRKV